MESWGASRNFQQRLSRAIKALAASQQLAGSSDQGGPLAEESPSRKRGHSDDIDDHRAKRQRPGDVSRKRRLSLESDGEHQVKRQRYREDLKDGLDARLELFSLLQECKTKSQLIGILSQIHRDEMTLAMALNDAPESLRRQAVSDLERRQPAAHARILQNMLQIQQSTERFDPQSIFPVLILREVFGDKGCFVCQEAFHTWENIVVKRCGRCPMHPRCLANEILSSRLPLNGKCPCAGDMEWRWD
ncbi:hypothetical protein VDGL01_11660 [Verticillium dahliae]